MLFPNNLSFLLNWNLYEFVSYLGWGRNSLKDLIESYLGQEFSLKVKKYANIRH